MKQEDELAMKVTKEIIIKYIETGRLSLNALDEAFKQVYETVRSTLNEPPAPVKGKAKT